MAFISPEINVPLTVKVKYADFAVSKKYGTHQVKLKGEYVGQEPDSAAFFPVEIVNELTKLGVLGAPKMMADGQTIESWAVNKGASAVTITRRDKAPYTVTHAGAAAPAPSPTPSAPAAAGGPSPDLRGQWGELATAYKQAAAIARQTWGEQYEPQALVAATATVFIAANQRGLKPAPTNGKAVAQQMREDFDGPPPHDDLNLPHTY